MGKKNKHSKDKLYKTVGELKSHHVGADRDLELSTLHRRLKYETCCLSLNAVSEKPVGLCDDSGFCYVFECDLLTKFLEKFKVHPVTGKKVSATDIIELKFHKNNEDQYHCPVIYKLFNQYSKIVANKKSGNVYSYEAVQQLNLKPNNYKDLLSDEPFEKNDIVTIQDPDRADEKWTVSEFHHIKNKLKIDDDESSSNIRNIGESSILKASLEEYKKRADSIVENFNKIVGQETDTKVDQPKLDKFNSAKHSDGSLARSVTSTVMPITSVQAPAMLSDEQMLYPKIKKKGYVQLVTNFGPMNLELFCDRAPKTCHNFLLLASRGYYNDTIFHRLIKNFILQGGDPTGTGSGGQSAWGEPFRDECHGDLKHEGRGVVAMANSGPATNKSQFYITLRGAWDHLDGKHTVFGRIVGGDETLERIEAVDVDKKDRPKKEIKIMSVVRYVDPFEELEKAIKEERAREEDERRIGKLAKSVGGRQPLKKFRSGVGAYINPDLLSSAGCGAKSANVKTNEVATMMDDIAIGAGGLSAKLASVSQTKSAKASGDFSNW